MTGEVVDVLVIVSFELDRGSVVARPIQRACARRAGDLARWRHV
jgi:hypothetical protein